MGQAEKDLECLMGSLLATLARRLRALGTACCSRLLKEACLAAFVNSC